MLSETGRTFFTKELFSSLLSHSLVSGDIVPNMELEPPRKSKKRKAEELAAEADEEEVREVQLLLPRQAVGQGAPQTIIRHPLTRHKKFGLAGCKVCLGAFPWRIFLTNFTFGTFTLASSHA